MSIFDNPFYILGATPQDNRHRLSTLAEEKSLLLDPAIVSEARNILLNPPKRLSAEIRWFPAVTKEKTADILSFCSDLQKGLDSDEHGLPDLDNLSALNVKLCALSFHPFKDHFQEKYAVLGISRLFEGIDIGILKNDINRDRTLSGFPPIIDDSDVENELRAYRSEIRQDLTIGLSKLPQEEYIELVTSLSEKYAVKGDRYSGDAVIGDILAEYELRMTPEIEDQKQQIINMAAYIGKSVAGIRLEDAIRDMSTLIVEWDKLTQPLQLAARGSGLRHSSSEEIANAIRELVIDLHNNYGKTSEGLELAKVLKDRFAELPDFSERISEDTNTLTRLKQEKEEDDRDEKESLRRNRMDKKYSITIYADKVSVPPFCTCCMKPTTTMENIGTSTSHQSGFKKTTHTISLSMPICADCMAHRKRAKIRKWLVVLMATSIAIGSVSIFMLTIDSHSDVFWVLPFVVAAIAYLLLGLIIKLPPLSTCHSTIQQSVWLGGIEISINAVTFTFTNWRYAKLFANANYGRITESERRNRAKARAYIKAIDHPIGVLFLALVFTGAGLIAFGNSLATQTSYSSPATTTQKPSTSYTSPATTPSNSSTQTKQQKLNAMQADLNKRLAEIEAMEDELEGLLSDLEYYESMYNSTQSNTYVNLYNNTLADYNDLYDEYEQAIDEYNDIVADYNVLFN